MAKLRPSLNVELFPGTGLPPDQVKLTPTDITPYLMNPEIAQMEADVTKARYGGSSIQDTAPAPFQKPAEGQVKDYSNRSGFEQSVFKQLGGNPFEIDVMNEVDRITDEQLPGLFKQVFGNQVTWEDSNRMSKAMNDHWQKEINRYRAHVKEAVESDKKTKIDTYNNIMKRFDNDAKEQEAAMKKVEAKQKDWLKTQASGKKEHSALRKEKSNLLKRLTTLAMEGGGIEETTTGLTEITDIQNRIQEINQILYEPERKASEQNEAARLKEKGQTSKKTMSDDEIQTRYNQLRSQGKTPAKIKDIFKKEGINIS